MFRLISKHELLMMLQLQVIMNSMIGLYTVLELHVVFPGSQQT